MSESHIDYHRLENYQEFDADTGRRYVICSFRTRNLGILQVEAKKLNTGWKFSTLPHEPDLNYLTESEQLYVQRVCAIVFRMVYDAPAAKERFA